MLCEAGHFLLFSLKEINSVTGYPLMCFHVIRGREKTKQGLLVKNGQEAISKLERNPVNFAEGHSRACFPRHNAEVVERQAESFLT